MTAPGRPGVARFVAALGVLAAGVACADSRPLAPVWDAAQIAKACDAGLARTRREIRIVRAKRGAGDIFGDWNRIRIQMEDVANPVYLMSQVHPDKAARDAAGPCLLAYGTLGTELFQDEALLRRVQAARPATPHQAKFKKDLMEGLEDSGVALPPGKRKRAKEIFDRIDRLRQDFDRRILEDPTRVIVAAEEMAGMSGSYLEEHAASRDEAGNYALTFKYSSYTPFMANARSEAARRRYYLAKLREGGEENLATLQELSELRGELAGLYGLPTYADYAVRRNMAGSPAAVRRLLDDVHAAVGKLEVEEIGVLREAKAKETGIADAKINRWDVAYYGERVRRERYDIDQEKLRAYFPTDKAVGYMMLVSRRLYGVSFTERRVPTWHPDVRYFDVTDDRSGKYIAGVYFDLSPREGKYTHAFAYQLRGASRVAHRTPLSVLVANFNRGLDHRDFEILMHEFGHVLHNVLSRTDYAMQSGANVKLDFVEAPSQMFEEWARRPQALALMRQACPRCPQLSGDEIRRLDEARRFGQGIRYANQWLKSAFDMELAARPSPPLALWKRLEAATPLGTVEGTMFPASFVHLADGYAAGYYAYLWSQVIALDMLSPFEADMLDPAVGRRFREAILANGGQEEETDMVRTFLGRAPSSDAFFAEITGRR